MTTTMTVEQIVAELRDMLEVTRDSHSLGQRLAGRELSVCTSSWQLWTPRCTGRPTACDAGGRCDRSVTPGAVPHDEVDIVIRAEPSTLHRLTSGELNGREAIVSGLLDIRKAPSMPKLLLMRGLFNQYKKAQARGAVPTTRKRLTKGRARSRRPQNGRQDD